MDQAYYKRARTQVEAIYPEDKHGDPKEHAYQDERKYWTEFVNVVKRIPGIEEDGCFLRLGGQVLYSKSIRFASSKDRTRALIGLKGDEIWNGTDSASVSVAADEMWKYAKDNPFVNVMGLVSGQTHQKKLIGLRGSESSMDGHVWNIILHKIHNSSPVYTLKDGSFKPKLRSLDRLMHSRISKGTVLTEFIPPNADDEIVQGLCCTVAYVIAIKHLYGIAL